MLASVTQLAVLAADHPQSRVVVIATEPEPPASVNEDALLATWSWHFCELGAEMPVEVWVDVQAEVLAATTTATASAAARVDKGWRPIFRHAVEMHVACQPGFVIRRFGDSAIW